MRKVLVSMILILVLSIGMITIAEAASGSAEFSTNKVTLDDENKEFKADITISYDLPFSGAEFTLKPEGNISIKSVKYSNKSDVEMQPLEKDGYYYFGFTNGENKFDGELNVGIVTFEYTGDKSATIKIEQADIIYIDENGSVKKDIIELNEKISVSREQDASKDQKKSKDSKNRKKSKDEDDDNKGNVNNNNNGTITISSFIDIPADFWAKTEIEFLASKGIINGREAGIFDPQGIVTRAEFAKMLTIAFDVVDENATYSFTDVNSTDWYSQYVASATKVGIINGYPDGTFKPNNSISRLEMAVMVGRAAKLKGYTEPANIEQFINFSDSNLITFGQSELAMAVQNGIINGKPGNMMDPAGLSTRAEAAAVIYRLYNLNKF